ncbi:LuxR C-terminal-related transcriptional regulator [Solwaraspora sp. WMMD406]|uniref:helix-turn-helix transcriptional regulator n=1 Tax=Solwaraspora sp. WMMD406 TaxID=3016095 RepID=UPI002417B0A2|nr:LuxR C-terminal-related transcriptional regulator [Solwaraspora sp. WMMD406]MDG4764420.1 LuxR C-terminal-related transcriptional regulator [Solwaraspora sp. WMMD406]
MNERRATYLWELGRRTEAVAAFRETAAELQEKPASAVKARVFVGVAIAALQAGRYQDGCEWADVALWTAVDAGARAEEGRALNVSGLALGLLGDPGGVGLLERAIEIARAVNHIEDLLRGYENLGLVLEHAGQLRASAETSAKGLEEAQRYELADTRQMMVLANNASAAFMLLGDWDKAEKIVTEAIQDRSPAESLYQRLILGEIKVARGAYAQAHELLDSIADADHRGDPRFLGPLHTAQALLSLGEGDLRRASDEVRRGVEAVRDGENQLELLRLCAVGLRYAADQRDATLGDWLAQAAWTTGRGQPRRPRSWWRCAARNVSVCTAATPPPSGTGSQPAGPNSTGRTRPAYARWRQAAATYARSDGSDPRPPAREAHQAATALGAEPSRTEVARLAAQIGLDLRDRPTPTALPYRLTPAEFETLRLLCKGLDPTAIARTRGVGVRTAQTQLSSIYRKLGVHSSVGAIAVAHRERLLR